VVSSTGGDQPDKDGAGRGDDRAVNADVDAAAVDADVDAAAGSIRSGGAPDDDRAIGRPDPDHGTDLICRVAVWATGAFVVASGLAAAWPDTFLPLSVPIDLVLFAAGCGAFLWAYALAIGRSRHETVTMGGLFFLGDDVAPPAVRGLLRGVLGVQVVVAVAAASVRPFTALAFSVLVPILSLGLMALWAARHGRFPAKPAPPAD
jgi:hypothetical protein